MTPRRVLSLLCTALLGLTALARPTVPPGWATSTGDLTARLFVPLAGRGSIGR
ncbi:MAG: hypothetical protein ACK2UL_07985 [Anaerolineae bacterium]